MKVFHLLLWDSYSTWFTWSWESLYCSQTCSLLIKSAIKSGSGSLRKFGTMHFSTIFKAVFRLILCPWNWDCRVTGCPILKKNSINLDRRKSHFFATVREAFANLAQCIFLQLNKYETAPNFIQLSQNLTSNCLLISVFLPVLPVFAWCDHNIVLPIKTKQFYDHIMQELVETGKFS